MGSNARLKVGDKLTVSRKVRDVQDPTTGAIIRTIVNEIGMCTVTEVDANSATVTFSGRDTPQVGDVVKN